MTINIPAGTYTRVSGYPTIAVPLTIQGAGAAQTIVNANGLDRGFFIDKGGVVLIAGVTIQRAASPGPSAIGTGLLNLGTLTLQDSVIADGTGGGIWNSGTMTLRNSSIVRNSSGFGAGIMSAQGSLTVINSLIAYNVASTGGGGFNIQQGSRNIIVNSTVSNNIALGIGPGIRVVDATSEVDLYNSTIAGNLQPAPSGYGPPFAAGIENSGQGVVHLQNTLLADNYLGATAADCDGPIISLDYNWLQTTANCTISGAATHNKIGGDPLLDELRDNGGPTPTRALFAGSAAIDAIPIGQCTDQFGAPLKVDQRGSPRPTGSACDIGAFEGSAPLPLFNANLIRNGDAEDSAGSPTGAVVGSPHWTVTAGTFTVVQYGAPGGFPIVGTDIIPATHGYNFFAGGVAASSQATQMITVTPGSPVIDTGTVRYFLSGDFGGYATDNDSAQLSIRFLDGNQLSIGSAINIGNFNAAYRNNKTGLFGASANGIVPIGTRYVQVNLQMTRSNGPYNDGYADNLSLIFIGGPGTPDLNQHGLTGSWYKPATSGQGIEVEVFPNPSTGTGSTFVSWFTYDTVIGGAERQRWYTAQGQVVSGQPNASLTIYQNTGGNFNAPPVTTAQPVGTATLSFDTCSSGQLSYSFTDGTGRTGSIPLTRLTQNVTCSTTTARPTNADFALSGNWFDKATSGQGFTAEVNPNSGAFFAAWYTYMPNGTTAGAAGQRWYTAQGAFTPGMRSIPVTIYETTGGMFDTPTPPGQQTVPVGSGTMAFQSCSSATFSYNFTGGSSNGLSGTITLSRVGPVPPGCTQ